MGNVAGLEPVLVMDFWEDELLLDYQPAQRAKYLEACFANIDWQAVEGRLQTGY
jgi:superoxide dismutase